MGVVEAFDEALGVDRERADAMLAWILDLPYVLPERDSWLVAEDDRTVAFGFLACDPRSDRSGWIGGRVHPDHRGRGIGGWLLAQAGASLAARAQEGERGLRASAACVVQDREAEGLFRAHGSSQIGSSWDMAMPLRGDEAAGEVPAGVRVRTFEPGDERAFYDVNQTAFEGHYAFGGVAYETLAAETFRSEGWEPTRTLLASRGDRTVGACEWVVDVDQAYVSSLGVLPDARGAGIGSAMLRRAIADAAAEGFRRLELTVDADEPEAVGLYERAGLRVSRSWHAYGYLTA